MTTSVETKKIAETFDDMAHDRCCEYKEKGLTASSQVLFDLVSSHGLSGKRVFEIGCGTGFFALQTLKQGAASCVGYDISTAAIEEANSYSKELGLTDKAKFEVADGAITQPQLSDIVVMDKVLCCYPDWTGLLRNAANASNEFLGFVVPRDEGWMKPLMRCGAAAINFVERIRKTGFKFYLHPLGSIDRRLIESGFEQTGKAKSRFWLIFAYTRTGESTKR